MADGERSERMIEGVHFQRDINTRGGRPKRGRGTDSNICSVTGNNRVYKKYGINFQRSSSNNINVMRYKLPAVLTVVSLMYGNFTDVYHS